MKRDNLHIPVEANIGYDEGNGQYSKTAAAAVEPPDRSLPSRVVELLRGRAEVAISTDAPNFKEKYIISPKKTREAGGSDGCDVHCYW